MMKQLVVLILGLLTVQASANTITPYPGTTLISNVGIDLTGNILNAAAKVTLIGGNSYTIATDVGILVVLTAQADCKIWVGASLQFPTLPTGWDNVDLTSFGLGARVAVGVYANITGALSNVKLVSPPLPFLGPQITAGINAGVLALDKSTGTTVFSALVATYDSESKRITVSLPVTLPVIIFGKVQAQVSASFGQHISTIAGANQTLQFDASTSVTFRSQVANVITVVKTQSHGCVNVAAQAAAQAAGRPLGVFLNISLAAAASHDSTIRISYNASDLINAGIQNAADIKLAYFNELTGAWEFGHWETIVNTTAQYIEARVPHFSTWAPIAIGAGSTVTPYPGTTLISNVGIDLTGGILSAAAKVTLVAGKYTIATNAGFLVVLTANVDCKIWVGASIQFPTLPTGWNQVDLGSFGIGAGIGIGVYANISGALSNVQLVSPPLPLFGAQITAGINAGVLALDQSTGTNVFSALVATYDTETKRITVSLPVTLPVILFGKFQSHVSAHFGSGISTIAGANQTLQFDASTSVTFRSQVANVITVVKSNAAASAQINAAAQAAGRPLGVFLNISLSASAAHDSTIRISYNASDLINAGIQNAASIKLAFFNEVTGAWDFGNWETIVNTTAQYIEAHVPHFSTWAPIAVGAGSTITPYAGTTLISNVGIDLTGNILNAAAKVTLTGGNSYTIATDIGFLVVLTANADCKVWVGASVQFPTLPTGWDQVDLTSFGLGARVAVGVYANITGALSNVKLVSPPLPFLGAQITAGINAGVLALDQSTGTNVFSALVATYDQETKRITVSLPVTLPVIIFGKVSAHVSARFNSAISTIGGANQTLDFDAGTSVTFRSQVANVITVIKTNAAASGAINAIAKAGRPLGVFLNISLAAAASHESTIRITYNQTDLINAGIQNEANLKLAFFNEATGTWDFGNWATTVNTAAHYVEANVPHFSTWAPIEQSGPVVSAASQASVSIVLMAVVALLALFQ